MTDPVRLKISRPRPSKSVTVEIDGRDYARLFRSLTVDLDAQFPFTVATAEMMLFGFEHDGAAVIQLGDETRDLLVKLGWTPPVDDALESAAEDLSDSDSISVSVQHRRRCPGPAHCKEPAFHPEADAVRPRPDFDR